MLGSGAASRSSDLILTPWLDVSDPTDRPFSFAGQEAFEVLSAAIGDAVLIASEEGTVLYAGPSLLGVLDLVHPDDAVRDEEGGFWSAALPFEREFRMRDASGEWVWVRAVSTTTDHDGQRPETVERVLGNRALLLVRDRSAAERARDADDLIHEAFDAVNNLVVVTDMRAEDNPLVVVNQNFVDTTGYSRDEIIGHNCRFLQTRPDGTRDETGDGQEEALDKIRTAVERGASTNVMLRNYKKDGTLFYNRLYLTPIRNGAGEVTHFVGVQNDVTDEVERSREAERQQSLLRSFFDSAPFLMGVVEVCDGEIVHRAANDAAASLFRSGGAEFGDVDGLTPAELGFTDEEAARWQRHIHECAMSNRPVRFETSFPWSVLPGDDDLRQLSVVLNPADGAEPLFSYVAEDVTERQAAEAERQLLAAAVEQAAESIVVTGPDVDAPGPEILYANRAHLRTFGYELDEVVGKTPRMYQGPKTDRAVLDRIRTRLEAGEPVRVETVNYRKDGSEFTLEWEIAPVKDGDGRVVNWVGTQRDVSERRQLEREMLQVSAREQERLARDLHDGLSQLLSGAAFKLQALWSQLERDGLDAYAADAQRTREIVEEALGQARAVSRGLHPIDIEPDGLMVALERLSADAAEAYGIDVAFTFDQPVLAGSREHAGHLYRIAQEAVANAARHGRAEVVGITLSHGADGVVTLSVQDDGTGIPEEALDEGGGLGLRTMQARADRVGGRLEVRRREGGGTLVTVTFLAPSPDPSP